MTKKKTNKGIDEKKAMITAVICGKIAMDTLDEVTDKLNEANKLITGILEATISKKLQHKTIFSIKTANQCIEDAKNKSVTLKDINHDIEVEKSKAKHSFSAWHKGKKTQAAHSEGFDDGCQATFKVLCSLYPEIFKLVNGDNDEAANEGDAIGAEIMKILNQG